MKTNRRKTIGFLLILLAFEIMIFTLPLLICTNNYIKCVVDAHVIICWFVLVFSLASFGAMLMSYKDNEQDS